MATAVAILTMATRLTHGVGEIAGATIPASTCIIRGKIIMVAAVIIRSSITAVVAAEVDMAVDMRVSAAVAAEAFTAVAAAAEEAAVDIREVAGVAIIEVLAKNLTPNPLPRGKGNKMWEIVRRRIVVRAGAV